MNYVDGARREYVGVARYRLIRLCALEALLEAAAVRNPTERSRDEVRIIFIAEADEDLVLIVCVVVSRMSNWLRCS